MPAVILECRGVSLHYQGGDGAAGREVLRGVSFALKAGERLFLALLVRRYYTPAHQLRRDLVGT